MSAGKITAIKAPIIIGGGLVFLTFAGAVAALFGTALPFAGEAVAVGLGMLAGAKVAQH